MTLNPALAASLALAATACAATPSAASGPQSFDTYAGDPRLGARVDRACFGARVDGFGERTRNSVVIEANPGEFYVLRTAACVELDAAQSIAFQQTGACLRQGDTLTPLGVDYGANPMMTGQPRACRISGIYGWNPAAEADASVSG
ncbi:MAG: DUF6491 family protein [Oceanicaulis sp.]